MIIKFTKMHGCGNDFLIIDKRIQQIHLPHQKIIEFSDYKKSTGFDQLITIDHSDKADASIRIFNSDGSEVNACGNGSRCIAKLILDENPKSEIVTIATKERILSAKKHKDLISINMGKAEIIENDIIFDNIKGTLVHIGNPHIIINIDQGGWTNKQKLANINLLKYGPIIENDQRFPNKTNVNFVSIENKNIVHLRTWERGTGATLSCGTGASASFYALYKKGLINKTTTIRQERGDLFLTLENGEITLTGEAKISYNGTI